MCLIAVFSCILFVQLRGYPSACDKPMLTATSHTLPRFPQKDSERRGESGCSFVVFGYGRLIRLSLSFMPKLCVNFMGFSRLTPVKSDV